MTSTTKAVLAGIVAFLLFVGGELIYLHHKRNQIVTPAAANQNVKYDPDDLVYLTMKHPSSMADMKDLYGKTVWVSAGGQMEYYPYAAHRADYAKSAGTLLGAEPLIIKDAFEQVAPKSATFRIKGGDKQVLLVFTMPKSADPDKLYAVPVGYQEGKDFTFETDELFFYDDPHDLYKHWGPQIWQAVDSHQAILGMNERQVELALGQVSKSVSNDYGNRLVVFANLGKPMAVTFVKNKATAIRPDQGF